MPGYGQSLGAALGQLAFGGGDPMNTKSGMQGMLDGAHAGAYDANRQQSLAQALKASAEAEQVTMQNRSRDPGAVLRNAMTNYGIPQDSAGAVEGFLKTGELGGGYQNSADGYGPSMPAPAWADKLPDLGRSVAGVNTALSVGEKNVENMAKADSIARDSRMKDGVMAGKVDPLLLAKAEYAGKGSAPFNFNEYGTGNNLTGTLDETTGAARNFADKRKSETQENKAQAGSANASAANSYASAGQHKASTDKIRQEITQGGKSGQNQIVTDAAGNITLVNKVNGASIPATYADGSKVGAKATAEKPLPEGAQKQLVGTRNLQDAVDQYTQGLSGWNNQKMLNPNERAMMGNAYNNMMLQAKEAYNLGVLNGPDYDILQAVVKDPTKAGSAMVTNDTLKKQADSLKKIAGNIERTVLESHNKPYTPRVNPNGAAPANAPTAGPNPGAVEDGYRFKGGNRSDPKNWEKV